jgi:PAS domain S-box-containing protein
MKKINTNRIAPRITDIILESISDGVFTVDPNWRITTFNRAAEEIIGISREEAIGKHCCEVFRANMCETDCALRRTMKMGKPFTDSTTYIVNSDKRRIPVTVCTALLKDESGNVIGGVETFRDMSIVEELRKKLDAKCRIGDIVSRSPLMHKLFALLPQVAQSNCTVLIQGETGTGKELIARAIHEHSPRNKNPFIAINCGALPDTLLESELFGYKAGAFTDAKKDKPGHFARARGGTLFLDEIGDISPAFQVRLLRVLQEHMFQPLGATKPVKADVRVICASNQDVFELVKKGKFRQDLFYRINVVCMDLPPLRKRKEDIPYLAEHFIHRLNRLHDKAVTGLSQEALSHLMAHDYPGNIRELENSIEHAFVLCPRGQITPAALPGYLLEAQSFPGGRDTIDSTLKSFEARIIIDALKRNGYNRLAAARDLGMHKSTLFRKIKALEIVLPKSDGRTNRNRAIDNLS